jgi:NitT/TauT family transport system permease protein
MRFKKPSLEKPALVAFVAMGVLICYVLGLNTHQILLISAAILSSWFRIGAMLALSVFFSLLIGVAAARNRSVELVVLPIVDVLESVPVISFFPVVLLVFIKGLGNFAGAELAADFLILTALIWNIILGVYESNKAIPNEILESTKTMGFGFFDRLTNVYAPASFPAIASNLLPSFASALFYLSESEIISIGSLNTSVFGIGSVSFDYFADADFRGLVASLTLLLVAITLTVKLVLEPTVEYSSRFRYENVASGSGQPPWFTRIPPRLANLRSMGHLGRLKSISRPFSSLSYLTSHEVDLASRIQGAKRVFSRRVLRALQVALIASIIVVVFLLASSSTALQQTFAQYTPRFVYALLVGTVWDLARILGAYGISVAISIPISYYMATRAGVQKVLYPILENIASFPAPLLYPLIIAATLAVLPAAFRITSSWYEVDVLSLTTLSAIWYILFNFHGAIKRIPTELWEAASIYRLSGFKKWRYIVLPGTAMSLVTGSMEAIGSYWAGLMIAEYYVVPHANKVYQTKFGLMKMLDLATYTGNLTQAGAITLFMIFVVSLITFIVWYPLISKLGKRFRFE